MMKLYLLIGITAAVLMFSVIGGYSLIFSSKKTDDTVAVDAEAVIDNAEAAGEAERRRFVATVCDEVCGNAPYLVRVTFCSVILNRCSSAGFPDTPAEVVFSDPIFSGAYSADFSAEPSNKSLNAYDDALAGFSPCQGALYFRTAEMTDATLIKRNTLMKIGKYYFS